MSPAQSAVIFDWNGTILADTKLSLDALNRTLSMLGAKAVTLADYQEAYSVPFVHMYKQFGCDEGELHERQKEIFETFAEHYEKYENRIRLRKGARLVLGAMKDSGRATGILSNYTVKRIKEQAKKFAIAHHFDAVLANEEATPVFYKKGKGERLKDFVEVREVRRALIVGDTPEEIEIAHAYGYVSVAITDGACSVSRLRAAKPDFLIRSLEEVNEVARHVFERSVK